LLDPSVACNREGCVYCFGKHPRTGQGYGGLMCRIQQSKGAMSGEVFPRGDSVWRHDGDFGMAENDGAFAVLNSHVASATSGRPWEEKGAWIHDVTLFNIYYKYFDTRARRVPGKVVNAKTVILQTALFQGMGLQNSIKPFKKGFIATYTKYAPDANQRRQALVAIGPDGKLSNTVIYGSTIGTVVTSGTRIFSLSFVSGTLFVDEWACTG